MVSYCCLPRHYILLTRFWEAANSANICRHNVLFSILLILNNQKLYQTCADIFLLFVCELFTKFPFHELGYAKKIHNKREWYVSCLCITCLNIYRCLWLNTVAWKCEDVRENGGRKGKISVRIKGIQKDLQLNSFHIRTVTTSKLIQQYQKCLSQRVLHILKTFSLSTRRSRRWFCSSARVICRQYSESYSISCFKINEVREIRWEGLDWIHLAQDRDQWWALVNTLMNLRVP